MMNKIKEEVLKEKKEQTFKSRDTFMVGYATDDVKEIIDLTIQKTIDQVKEIIGELQHQYYEAMIKARKNIPNEIPNTGANFNRHRKLKRQFLTSSQRSINKFERELLDKIKKLEVEN